ncbi:hypothetical protein PV682_43945, partial [Streptomyces niveiscabiei]|uniref:hypothetical protein n=1 Tax=Streptomyces niveiscabiei TaxID=164115 RepID=UPI0029A232BC
LSRYNRRSGIAPPSGRKALGTALTSLFLRLEQFREKPHRELTAAVRRSSAVRQRVKRRRDGVPPQLAADEADESNAVGNEERRRRR